MSEGKDWHQTLGLALGIVVPILSVMGWLASTMVSGFKDSEMRLNQLEERIRVVEQLRHAHKEGGSALYPPHWRKR